MIYTTLGAGGAKISRVSLGTMNFGNRTDKKESFAIMDCALENGINLFDCADFYGAPAGQRVTEKLVGEWMADRKSRDEIVLTTKVYATVDKMGINDRGLSRYHIRRGCENSLKSLQTDHIDLYFLHHIDRGYRMGAELKGAGRTAEYDLWTGNSGTVAPSFSETLETLDALRQADKISYIGTSNFPAWSLAMFNMLAKERNMQGSVVEQCCYSLMRRSLEVEVIPACRELGMGLMTYSPLAGGFLAGYEAFKSRNRLKGVALDPELAEKMKAYDKLCAELGEKPASVSSAWVLHKKIVSTVLLGPGTVDQLKDSLHVLSIELPEDFVKAVEAIWDGPHAEAPEYYLW